MEEIERTEPATMRLRADAALLVVTMIWGSSFMFIKVAVRDIAPSTALLGRVALGTLALALLTPF